MSEKLKELTNDNFQEEVINDNGVVMVDFYAEWCAPCKILAKTMEELNDEIRLLNSKVKLYKADVETNSDIIRDLGISNVPAILIFKNGELVNKYIGLRSKKDLQHDLEKICNE